MAQIRILGSGTSTGVPEIGCQCEVCTSNDPRDHRSRCSSLINTGNANILIDCGPDFWTQVQDLPFQKIDAVLITHEHYDHVGGLDDLRPFCQFGGKVDVYAEEQTANALRERMPYCFAENKYPGAPNIVLHDIKPFEKFMINDTEVLPVRVMHGKFPILGYRIDHKIGYITDKLTMPQESYEAMKGLDVLVMNALRKKKHFTHQTLEVAIETAQQLNAKQTYFIHMSHHMGRHADVERELPENVNFAYDGLLIE